MLRLKECVRFVVGKEEMGIKGKGKIILLGGSRLDIENLNIIFWRLQMMEEL
jgi:hypothetical protein